MTLLQEHGEAAVEKIADGIAAESEHKTLDLIFAIHTPLGRCVGQVACWDCDRRWRSYLSMEAIIEWERAYLPPAFRGHGTGLEDYLIREMLPEMSAALDQPCWQDASMGKTAEWITQQLLSAGPRGMLLETLVDRAIRGRQAPADRLIFLLGYMGLLPKGPEIPAVVKLPADHPMASWEKNLPHPMDGTQTGEGVLLALRGSAWWPA